MTKYSESFKEMIVDLSNNGTKAMDLSSEYGISEAAIYKWEKSYTKDPKTGVNEKQMQTLRKEIKQLKLENEILKKAAAIFAQNPL
ncbi:transposase [Staphylococcus pseudoxylosus]|uniref:transposase n=1 Tax=Staphylococcus pseudoxylosus TaxID=2282419 RepID=UPI002DB6AC34|nr:transposase [Staphylococcus pseudoxylosus]MEB6038092.1 transposase [Staphylococcus pseudoxylosus]MEB7765345.1 transposase [Staphylococcus pseudoxylosus]MEB8086064.1 transposase [Staphylococcus pseudoxylosus]